MAMVSPCVAFHRWPCCDGISRSARRRMRHKRIAIRNAQKHSQILKNCIFGGDNCHMEIELRAEAEEFFPTQSAIQVDWQSLQFDLEEEDIEYNFRAVCSGTSILDSIPMHRHPEYITSQRVAERRIPKETLQADVLPIVDSPTRALSQVSVEESLDVVVAGDCEAIYRNDEESFTSTPVPICMGGGRGHRKNRGGSKGCGSEECTTSSSASRSFCIDSVVVPEVIVNDIRDVGCNNEVSETAFCRGPGHTRCAHCYHTERFGRSWRCKRACSLIAGSWGPSVCSSDCIGTHGVLKQEPEEDIGRKRVWKKPG
mmetsp:Transcript_1564/g.2623  ORF Transcript_1564/g.2623 Transcript_1564/m.2623 type:complete len:313 (+) Transcript_1564:45-983(+)